MLVCYGSEVHYIDHLAPIVRAIPGAELHCGTEPAYLRGRSLVGDRARLSNPRDDIGPPILVAARKDLMRLHRSRRVGMLEHGAGQTYVDDADHPSYAGGRDLNRLALVLSPGPHSAERWRKAYPHLEVVELHGSPRLDWHHGLARRLGPRHPVNPVIGVGWHWDCRVCPETRQTWPYWIDAVSKLHDPIVGHAHPRAWTAALTERYATMGATITHEFTDVLDQATVYVCDNSSTMYEFAALDRPVICLDHPLYRRHTSHGLRFWNRAPGMRIGQPDQLRLAIDHAHAYPRDFEHARQNAVDTVYGGWPDGGATERAVDAIAAHLL